MVKILTVFTLLISVVVNSTYALTLNNSLRPVEKLNIALPFLGLGTVELGRDWGIDVVKGQTPTDNIAKNVLTTAIAKGWTVIDTAPSYQLSEGRIAKYIPPDRYHYFLITKAGEHSVRADSPQCKSSHPGSLYCQEPASAYDFSYAGVVNDVNESLKKLHIKTLDAVLLHLNNDTAGKILQKGEALQALEDLKKDNKIKYIGVSVNGPAAIQAIKTGKIDIIELEYNLLNQTNKSAINLAHSKGIGVIVRGGLGTGLLTADVKQHLDDPNLPFGPQIKALLKITHQDFDQLTALALAFLYKEPNVHTVILGADRPEYIEKDIQLLKQFSDEDLLTQAKKVLLPFGSPKDFTEIMGTYYQQSSG